MLTAVGQDPADRLDQSQKHSDNNCLAGSWEFQVTIKWPRHHRSNMVGTMLFTNAAFDVLLEGTLGGASLLGRAGLGSDPDKPAGECTDQRPYTYWSLAGQFALADTGQGPTRPASFEPARAGQAAPIGPKVLPRGGANHVIVIDQFHYLGGGNLNGPNGMDPNISASLVSYPVTQGDTITFVNVDTRPHTVTSCFTAKCDPRGPAVTLPAPAPQVVGSQTDRCLDRTCASGVFDSDTRLDQTGGTFAIDTSKLAPGRYDYFCEFHRFMRGSFTVSARPGRLSPSEKRQIARSL